MRATGRRPDMSTEIPPHVLYASPVPLNAPNGGPKEQTLPLSLIAHVISFVEDVGDIARMTRTCRLMYYMTLPVLYERVTLRSYPETRYVDGRPEGYGSGSPFAMGLSGLASGNSAPLVKEFTVTGAWLEPGIDEYSRGKIPDSTIMLGIALRAAMDRMTHLKSLTWDLDSKPTKSIYQGLALRPTLTSLSLRFPRTRSPRPIVLVPPMPNLRSLRVSDIDPLCYPDDISVLILNAKKLDDLRIHWSPRMRQEAEPSINLRTIFGKCLEAGYRLRVTHVGLQNFYGPNTGDLQEIFDSDYTQSTDFIDTFGGTYSRPTTIWVDETWKHIPGPKYFKNFKKNRISEPALEHAKILTLCDGLEELYMIGGNATTTYTRDTNGDTQSPACATPATSCSTPGSFQEKEAANTCKAYLRALTINHGQTLTKLLLCDQWPLSGTQIGELVSKCPKLEQLGFALDRDAGGAMTLLAPFFANLKAVRILANHNTAAILEEPGLASLLDGTRTEPLYWKCLNATVRYCGIADVVLKLDPAVQMMDEEGNYEWRNVVTVASREDVQKFEIWRLDALELHGLSITGDYERQFVKQSLAWLFTWQSQALTPLAHKKVTKHNRHASTTLIMEQTLCCKSGLLVSYDLKGTQIPISRRLRLINAEPRCFVPPSCEITAGMIYDVTGATTKPFLQTPRSAFHRDIPRIHPCAIRRRSSDSDPQPLRRSAQDPRSTIMLYGPGRKIITKLPVRRLFALSATRPRIYPGIKPSRQHYKLLSVKPPPRRPDILDKGGVAQALQLASPPSLQPPRPKESPSRGILKPVCSSNVGLGLLPPRAGHDRNVTWGKDQVRIIERIGCRTTPPLQKDHREHATYMKRRTALYHIIVQDVQCSKDILASQSVEEEVSEIQAEDYYTATLASYCAGAKPLSEILTDWHLPTDTTTLYKAYHTRLANMRCPLEDRIRLHIFFAKLECCQNDRAYHADFIIEMINRAKEIPTGPKNKRHRLINGAMEAVYFEKYLTSAEGVLSDYNGGYRLNVCWNRLAEGSEGQRLYMENAASTENLANVRLRLMDVDDDDGVSSLILAMARLSVK
ncbi:hypothetical protein D6C82_08716 [Aureobasidium pullulans]|nr:hypothetical protein D6C82_08716 [Aureobasidium pullulans]